VGHVARIGEKINAHNILREECERLKPLGRRTHRWDDNIEMDLREIRWGDVFWIHLAKDRDQCWPLVNPIINLCVSREARCILSYSATTGLPRRIPLL
jgi:hypothetical protein